MKPETERWLLRAERHLGSAGTLRGAGYSDQAVFFCQQAIEVLLKAFLVQQSPIGRPRRTHDLVSLAQEAGLAVPREQLTFLDRLGGQYTATRYGNGEVVEYTDDEVGDYLQQTERLFLWLRQQLS